MAHRGHRQSSPPPSSSPSSSSSRYSSPAPAERRRSVSWIGGYPYGVRRAALSETSLAEHFRAMHPARPPGSTGDDDYAGLGSDQPPEYASEREEDHHHHHGVVSGTHTGRNSAPSPPPIITPLSAGYNHQTGLDPETLAAEYALAQDVGQEPGALSDDELPEYDHGHGHDGNPVPHPPPGDDQEQEDWSYIPSYRQPDQTPRINVDGSHRDSDGGEDDNASSAPDYVPHAHLDQRSNLSSVHSNRALSDYAPSVGGTRSRASSLRSQLSHQDHHRSRASSFHSEHAPAAHQHEGPAGAGGGRRRGPPFARKRFSFGLWLSRFFFFF